jgi:DNA segregation ATPase FtsK/SpoIIIE, S-DNA-T family
VAGAGKSGVLNIILATLTTCPDVVLWGIDLKDVDAPGAALAGR